MKKLRFMRHGSYILIALVIFIVIFTGGHIPFGSFLRWVFYITWVTGFLLGVLSFLIAVVGSIMKKCSWRNIPASIGCILFATLANPSEVFMSIMLLIEHIKGNI
jgi:hypothetical protein